MKKLMILAAMAAVFTSCLKEADPLDEIIIPATDWSWDKPEELRALCVYLDFQKNQTTKEEIEELWHNAARIMIPYKGVVKMLKCTDKPGESEVKTLVKKLQNDSTYCDFSDLKKSMDYFLSDGNAVCVDVHEFIGYFLYTNGEGDVRDSSLFVDAYEQNLLNEFEIQLAGFLQRNYAEQVKSGGICLELLNEAKNENWEDIQKYLAQKISRKYPELCLAVRPDQSYSPYCLRGTWFDSNDYRDIRHITFVNFWFAERPDIGASPVDFTIQYDKFVKKRNGEDVQFNIFGGQVTGFYSHQEYTLSKELLEEEFEYCQEWAENNGEKIFFAELGCIRYADPEGQYFLSCLKFGQEHQIGLALFEVGAKFFFNYDGDVPFYLNDRGWEGFKYLQMSPAEINNEN
jgi:hypothetical protein